MVVVSISETYDLHTIVNKMSLIGVHTPKASLIMKTYPGLCMNCKYWRVVGVDVTLSTAQQLPLGVDQIGLDTGQIRPQDMMNPILFKAVSNDSWSTLEARLAGLGAGANNPVIDGNMAVVDNDHVTDVADEHGVYYSLLSNRDGFRVAHPQQGLQMRGLTPLVFQRYFTHGENYLGTGVSEVAPGLTDDANGKMQLTNIPAGTIRGRPVPMPRINTTYLTGADVGSSGSALRNGMGDGTPWNCQIQMPVISPVMCAAIVLPPVTATTGVLYYRMVVRSYIEFTEIRPITEVTSFQQMSTSFAPSVYYSDYEEQSKQMDSTTDMVDVRNADIEKIMEGR